jgi:hypothetical protein
MRTRPANENSWLAATLIATPLLWIAAEVVSPPLKSNAADQLATIASHSGRWYWYTVLLVAGTITLVPAALAVAKVPGGRAAALTRAGAALIGFGAIVAVGDSMTQFMTWQMAHRSSNRAQMAALLDRFDNSAGASIFFAPGAIALLVGTGLLTAALLRARACSTWTAAAFAAGIVINLAGFIASNVALIAAGAVILLVPAVQLSRRLLNPATPMAAPASPLGPRGSRPAAQR